MYEQDPFAQVNPLGIEEETTNEVKEEVVPEETTEVVLNADSEIENETASINEENPTDFLEGEEVPDFSKYTPETDTPFSLEHSIEEMAAFAAFEASQNLESMEELNEVSSHLEEEAAVQEDPTIRKVPMRIKEIKCGVTVIANIGNYENIRTHLEATAEIEKESDLMDAMSSLNNQLKQLSRKEYLEIKQRTVHSKQKLGNRLNPY